MGVAHGLGIGHGDGSVGGAGELVDLGESRGMQNRGAPTDAATFEMVLSLATEATFAVAMQRRRLRSVEPEDEVFIFRYWFDLQFTVIALRRLRRAAELAESIPPLKASVVSAIAAFDAALPDLRMMRDVGEHINEYARDRGRKKEIRHRQLQVGTWDGMTYSWLGGSINVDDALGAAEALTSTLRTLWLRA